MTKHSARFLALFPLAMAALLAGCPAFGEPTVTLKGKTFTVEIADDAEEQIRGMMFRRELAPDRGMIFLFANAERQAFWMKNCYIPLDIMYFDGDAKFINGHYGVPGCTGDPCPQYPSEKPARYVLELGAGIGRALELAPGDPITLP